MYGPLNPLQYALEFAGYSTTNKYETIHGNKIGARATEILADNNLFSLVAYRNDLQDQVARYYEKKRIAAEQKRRQDEEIQRKQAELQLFAARDV